MFLLALRANKHVFASFFAILAVLSERSERAVKKKIEPRRTRRTRRTACFCWPSAKKKSLNHEDHEGHEEKQVFFGPEGQKFILCDLGGLERAKRTGG
jgi:hypothetical protein